MAMWTDNDRMYPPPFQTAVDVAGAISTAIAAIPPVIVNALGQANLDNPTKGTIAWFDGTVWKKLAPGVGKLTQDAQGNLSWAP